MAVSVVRTAAPPLVILGLLELADTALARGEVTTGREYVASALRRLQVAKRAEDLVLDADARTPEVPGTSLDLAAS